MVFFQIYSILFLSLFTSVSSDFILPEQCSIKECVKSGCPEGMSCFLGARKGDVMEFCCDHDSILNLCDSGLWPAFPVRKWKVFRIFIGNCPKHTAFSWNTNVCCPSPYSMQEYYKVLPQGFNYLGSQSITACNRDSDCPEHNSYCSPPYNTVFGGNDLSLNHFNKTIKLCFPHVGEGVVMYNSTIQRCEQTKDCGKHELCYAKPLSQRAPFNDKMEGVCVKTIRCRSTATTIYGIKTINSTACHKDEDCIGADGNDPDDTHAQCVLSTTNTDNKLPNGLCCLEKNKACDKAEKLKIKCRRDSDCQVSYGDYWCDKYDKICCIDRNYTARHCPDRYTLVGKNELKCKAGICPKKNGVCINEYCCSPVTTAYVNKFTFLPVQASHSYITEIYCNRNMVVDKKLQFAFCDTRRKKVIILGKYNDNSEEYISANIPCNLNSDCDKGQVCVSINNEGVCYYYNSSYTNSYIIVISFLLIYMLIKH